MRTMLIALALLATLSTRLGGEPLFVEGNVRTQSPNGEVFADKLNFDFNDKKLKISMYENNEKVNVKTKIK